MSGVLSIPGSGPLQPRIFKRATASASGNTALWTPTNGKRFRLLKYFIDLSTNSTLSVAGLLTVSLLDGSTDIAQDHMFFVPSAPGNQITTDAIPLIDLGGIGILSSTLNNVLNINLSVALTAGICNVLAMGIEE